MSKVRFVIVPVQKRWTIRRVSRRMGSFNDETQAVSTALQAAMIERRRGQSVEVLKPDPNGRWDDVLLTSFRAFSNVVLL